LTNPEKGVKHQRAGDPGALNGELDRIARVRDPPGFVENIGGFDADAIDGGDAIAGLEARALRRTIRINTQDLLAMTDIRGFWLVANLHGSLLMANRVHPEGAIDRGGSSEHKRGRREKRARELGPAEHEPARP
jgi:hypothetical protein